jgi:hypothetical protein
MKHITISDEFKEFCELSAQLNEAGLKKDQEKLKELDKKLSESHSDLTPYINELFNLKIDHGVSILCGIVEHYNKEAAEKKEASNEKTN